MTFVIVELSPRASLKDLDFICSMRLVIKDESGILFNKYFNSVFFGRMTHQCLCFL
jgi:hypothetical protein